MVNVISPHYRDRYFLEMVRMQQLPQLPKKIHYLKLLQTVRTHFVDPGTDIALLHLRIPSEVAHATTTAMSLLLVCIYMPPARSPSNIGMACWRKLSAIWRIERSQHQGNDWIIINCPQRATTLRTKGPTRKVRTSELRRFPSLPGPLNRVLWKLNPSHRQ